MSRSTTSQLTLDRLRRDGEAFSVEISREYYLAHSGQKDTADLQPIYARHAHVTSADALAVARDAFTASADGSEEHRAARLLLDWQVDAQSGRELAAL